MKKNSSYLFNQVPSASIQRSYFPRHFNYKTTIKGDYLYPIYVDEVLPGDSIKIKVNMFARMATQIVPLLDNAYIDVFAFFVPNRLVWDNWQHFMGEKDDPTDTTEYLNPIIKSQNSSTDTTDNGFAALSLYDYFGFAVGKSKTWADAKYPRAYQLIYNEWFRDENLIAKEPLSKGDGPDYQSDFKLLKRAKARDYFTSSLPWPQKGSASQINVGGFAPVYGSEVASTLLGDFPADSPLYKSTTRGLFMDISSSPPSRNIAGRMYSVTQDGFSSSNVFADLSNASGISINQLRMSYQFQRLLERDARSGSRYTEILRGHFGVVSPDARLQRPEFLGMFSSKVSIQAIAQNSSSDATSPQANLAAIGLCSGSSQYIVKSFVEHGILMFIANLRGDVNYDQGMPRMFTRQTRNDFYWPAYAHLGEQAILNKEIYCQGDAVVDSDGNIVDEKVFGYIPRFDEYRFCKNQITGELRGSYSQSLNYWTLTEQFANLPALNRTFIEQNTPFSRAQAVSSDPTFLVDLYFENHWVRPMPTFGVPGWVDHF